jgi:hypothetical protein
MESPKLAEPITDAVEADPKVTSPEIDSPRSPVISDLTNSELPSFVVPIALKDTLNTADPITERFESTLA